MQIKKWCGIVFYVAMTGLVVDSEKVYSQEPGRGFSPPADSRLKKPSLKNDSPEDIAEKETKWMTKKLKLKKEQLQRVRPINEVYAFKRHDYAKAIRSGSDENKKNILDKLAVLDKEKDEELRRVLTEKQFNLYLEKKAELIRLLQKKDVYVNYSTIEIY
jgi:hypothetical protein